MDGIGHVVSVPIITALVYVVMMVFKTFVGSNEYFVRLIPALAVMLGMLLGALVFFIAPELISAGNVFAALLIGASSGLAATGTHQVIKQLQKSSEDFDYNDSDLDSISSSNQTHEDSNNDDEKILSEADCDNTNDLDEDSFDND